MYRFSDLFIKSFFIVAIFLLPAISNFYAATLPIEDTRLIDNLEIHFEWDPELIIEEKEKLVSKEKKQTNHFPVQKKQATDKIKENKKSAPTNSIKKETRQTNLTLVQRNQVSDKRQENQKPAPTNSVNEETKQTNHSSPIKTTENSKSAKHELIVAAIIPPSFDIIKKRFEKLNEYIEEEARNEILSNIIGMNSGLNHLNEKISLGINQLFIVQHLYSRIGNEHLFMPKQLQPLAATNKLKEHNPYDKKTLENIPNEQPDGFLGFLLKIPKYFFNLKNFTTLMVTLLFLSVLLKILNFILNRIY